MKPLKTSNRKTDWDAIERDYRAGILSIREIAKINDITDTAIRKKAKADRWERDLTAKVQEKVRTELVRSEVRTADAQTEREIVDVAAATVVLVVRGHRKDISAGRQLVITLLDQLSQAAGDRPALEAEVELETDGDKSMERRSKLMKAISLPVHAATVRDLSTAMKNLVGLERQAFSIGTEPVESEDKFSKFLTEIAARGRRLPIRE